MGSQEQRAARQPRHSEIVAEAGHRLGLKVLMANYEIMIALYEDGAVSAGELSTRCSWSSSAFYAALQTLAARELVISEQGQHDHRETIYSLPEEVRAVFDERFHWLVKWFAHHLGVPVDVAGIRINQFIREMEQELKIRFFTPEYEFILFLYEYKTQTPSDIQAIARSSHSTLYNIIGKLTRKGLIEFEIDPLDKRRKIYRLSSLTRRILDRTHRKLLRFLIYRLDPI